MPPPKAQSARKNMQASNDDDDQVAYPNAYDDPEPASESFFCLSKERGSKEVSRVQHGDMVDVQKSLKHGEYL